MHERGRSRSFKKHLDRWSDFFIPHFEEVRAMYIQTGLIGASSFIRLRIDGMEIFDCTDSDELFASHIAAPAHWYLE